MSETSLVAMPFSWMRTRKLSWPRMTGRLAPGAKVELVMPGFENMTSARFSAVLRWISPLGTTVTVANWSVTIGSVPSRIGAGGVGVGAAAGARMRVVTGPGLGRRRRPPHDRARGDGDLRQRGGLRARAATEAIERHECGAAQQQQTADTNTHLDPPTSDRNDRPRIPGSDGRHPRGTIAPRTAYRPLPRLRAAGPTPAARDQTMGGARAWKRT